MKNYCFLLQEGFRRRGQGYFKAALDPRLMAIADWTTWHELMLIRFTDEAVRWRLTEFIVRLHPFPFCTCQFEDSSSMGKLFLCHTATCFNLLLMLHGLRCLCAGLKTKTIKHDDPSFYAMCRQPSKLNCNSF